MDEKNIASVETSFHCDTCNCTITGNVSVVTDIKLKEKYLKMYEDEIELIKVYNRNRIIIRTDVEKHNSTLWNRYFNKWYMEINLSDIRILRSRDESVIKQLEYDSILVDYGAISSSPVPHFDYIKCPVCNCRKYLNKCGD